MWIKRANEKISCRFRFILSRQMPIWGFLYILCIQVWVRNLITYLNASYHINPIQNRLWKNNVDQRGGPLWIHSFFSFGATKSPKLNLETFLALRKTWKVSFDNFRFLSFTTRGLQISINNLVEKLWIPIVDCHSVLSWF